MSNFFGSTQTQQSVQPANSFGPSTQQPTPSSNPFAHLNTPASPVNNVFGKQEQKAAAPATSAVFGVPNPTQASTTNNLFGTSTLFGQQAQPSPATNVFGNLNNKATASTTESNSQSQQTSAGSVFGNKEAKSTNDLFGNLNKPVDQSVTQSKVNGSTSENNASNSSSVFSKSPSAAANIFGTPKSLVSSLVVVTDAYRDHSKSLKFNTSSAKQAEAASGLRQSATPQASGNMFSAMKPLDAPASARQPPPNGMFPSLEQVKSPQKLGGLPSAIPNASSNQASSREPLRRDEASIRQQMKEASGMRDESVAHLIPPSFDGFQQKAFYQGYRMQALNNAMSNFFALVHPDEDATPVLEFYMQQRGLIMGNSQSLKQKADEESDEVDHPGKRSKQSVQSTSSELHEKQSKRKLHDEEDQENENPSKRTRQFESISSARGATNGEINFNGQASIFVNGNNFQPSTAPPPSSEAPQKRKADNQITKDSEQRSPLRNMTPKPNEIVEANSSGSSTSNIFRNILDSTPNSPVKASPERKMAGLPEISKSDAPRTNAFANLPGVSSPAKSMNAPSSMFGTKTTPAISLPSQTSFAPNAISETSNSFTAKPATISTPAAGSISTDQKSNVLKPPKFNTGTNFLEQFNRQAEETEEKELKKAIAEDYDSDDDLEEFKANWKAERLAKRKAIEDSAKTSKGFMFKSTLAPPPDATSSIKEGSKPANMAFASFTAATPSSTIPSSLFGQIASSQASNSISSSVNSSRTPTPAFGSSTGSVLGGNAPANPVKFGNIFAHLSDADSGKGGDADDESAEEDETETSDAEGDSEKKDPTYQPNGESASGPGTPAEETGPGLASAKKPNPLASAFSSASPSGTSTPTSLFERIGPKDSNGGTATPKLGLTGGLFNRITRDASGNVVRHTFTEEKENTQPDKASPFGDNKNAFNKSTSAPSDNTWKPDSPIRFGGTTPRQDGQDSAPTVSVTAATPTKTGSPSNIFGGLNKTAGSSPKPLSNLFGNLGGETKSAAPLSNLFGTPSNATKSAPANVGFAFGASSTTSSLFPSAAASANTSRATTPGGTTDGDGDNSGDGDAEQEKVPDFDLSSVGPGGEHEEVIHEIRAKALKFSQIGGGEKGSRWESKGVGPLRVLKHKETGVSRVLLRMDPSGVIILNKGLLPGVKYEPKEKTVKFLAAGVDGRGLETWILQVKSPEIAEALSEVLEANKPT
jgi:hypothetical protein